MTVLTSDPLTVLLEPDEFVIKVENIESAILLLTGQKTLYRKKQ